MASLFFFVPRKEWFYRVKQIRFEDDERRFESGTNTPEVAFDEIEMRNDDIDQLTDDYIKALMGFEPSSIDDSELGLDKAILETIEDQIEAVLAELGFIIYRPVYVTDEDGNEVIARSQYADDYE